MKTVREELELFSVLFNTLEDQMGKNTELVLYDFLTAPKAMIADIRNGHLSHGRASFAGRWLPEDISHAAMPPKELCNQLYTSSEGSVFRCSAAYLFDEHGKAVGAVCINQDITKTLEMERSLHNMNRFCPENMLPFVSDVSRALENLIEEAREHINLPFEKMTKDDKIEFIRYLDNRGAFLVTKSGDRICALLDISKYTLYSYLDIIRI
ncbi:MAG: transcriptional regulator [Lachnospiraceae bacterium]|nr:transcriptional regulator [Lachnospiraceae bacterium]